MRVRLILSVLALGLAGLASAAEAEDDSAPVATADGGPGVYTLDDQIADWRKAGEAAPDVAPTVELAPGPGGDRRPHGVVSVGVGNHGYRSVYAATTLPVGRTGVLGLAIGDERGRVYGRDWRGRSLALGLSFDAAAPTCPPPSSPTDSPWRRPSAVEAQRLQAACGAAEP